MPGRTILLISGEIYHVFNKGLTGQPIFTNKRDYQRFFETIIFYQNKNTPMRYSKFLILSGEEREKILENLIKRHDSSVELICYCLMPNHFHLLLRQNENNGISKFIGDLTNSYTRYFNVKNKRHGPLFQGKFKAVRIEDDDQLLHVSRYIHLNPYTSYVVKNIKEISVYPYSSFSEYLKQTKDSSINHEPVLSNFKTKKSFMKFTFDRADYQKELGNIKHLALEK